MKFFIKKTLIFIIVTVFPFIIVEIIFITQKNNFLDEKNLENYYFQEANLYKWVEILENDTIFLLSGSSSTKYGLSCKELNKLDSGQKIFASIAGDARGPIETYFILKYLNLSHVKKIYFSLDPWIYTKSFYKSQKNILYLDFNFLECCQYFLEHDKYIFFSRYKAVFLKKFQKKIKKVFDTPKDYGSCKLVKASNDTIKLLDSATIYYSSPNFNKIGDIFQIEKYGWSALQYEYLKKIESLCINNKIKFYLFLPPKRSDFSKSIKNKFIDSHNEFKKMLADKEIKSQIFSKFDILDKFSDSSFFVDSYHLNYKGQIKFSKLFYKMSKSKMDNFKIEYSWFLNSNTHSNDDFSKYVR